MTQFCLRVLNTGFYLKISAINAAYTNCSKKAEILSNTQTSFRILTDIVHVLGVHELYKNALEIVDREGEFLVQINCPWQFVDHENNRVDDNHYKVNVLNGNVRLLQIDPFSRLEIIVCPL